MAEDKYGLWYVSTLPVKTGKHAGKTKPVAVVESNEAGVKKWMKQNGHREDRCVITLLPSVEYFDPVDTDKHILDIGGIVSTATVAAPARTKPLSETAIKKLIKQGAPLKTVTGHCVGSGMKVTQSKIEKDAFGNVPPLGGYSVCPACKKKVSCNGSRWNASLRKHKP